MKKKDPPKDKASNDKKRKQLLKMSIEIEQK